MGADTTISTLGAVTKLPNFQIITSQMITASGTGHQSLISLDRESDTLMRTTLPQFPHMAVRISREWKSGTLTTLLMFYRDQKFPGAGSPCLQHRLYHDALWRNVIR